MINRIKSYLYLSRKYLMLVGVINSVFVFTVVWFTPGAVLGESDHALSDDLVVDQEVTDLFVSNTVRPPQTVSSFKIETMTEEHTVAYETVRNPTEELLIGEEEVAQVGKIGRVINTFSVIYWGEQEVARDLVSQVVDPAITEVIKVGTRKAYRYLDTPEGEVRYYQTRRMWAMSYDGNCAGCSGRTYLGTAVKHGVCAVDPSVIPLGTYVYVPGYGMCHAEDIGGAIKGNLIDLGFEDVTQGWWSSRYVEVYFIE